MTSDTANRRPRLDPYATPAVNPPGEATPAPTPEEAAAKGKKSKSTAKREAVQKEAKPEPVVNNAVVAQPAQQPAESLSSQTTKIGTLYINCRPVTNVKMHEFHDLVMKAREVIQQVHQVDDYRFIQYQAAGVFHQAMAQVLDQLGDVAGVVMETNTPEAGICSSLLWARAGLVVMGTR